MNTNTTIKVSKNELLGKLRVVGRIVQPSKAALAAAGQFWFKTTADGIVITGTDISGSVSAMLECIDVVGEADFCVEAKQLINGLSKIVEQPVTLIIGDKKVKIEYFGGFFEMPVLESGDFPKWSEEKDARLLEIERGVLLNGMGGVINCVGNDELRPTISSMFIEKKEGILTFVGTNGNVLSMREYKCSGDDVSAIVPAKAAKLIMQLLPACEETVTVEISDKRISIASNGYAFVYRLAEGKYPDYRRVIPDNPDAVEVGVNELVSAIKRVSVFAESEFATVVLNFDKKTLTISSENRGNKTQAKEELEVKSDFRLKIGLKSDYTVMMLETLKGKTCRMSFSDAGKAMVITPVDDAGVLMLQMPVMIV